MKTTAELSLDLFLLGHAHLAAGQAGQGAAFERRVRWYLNMHGLPDARGFRVFGARSASGLYHQIDEQTACHARLVIGEWKAYSGQIPKNDLLRFKAATEDYWIAGAENFSAPILRIFGGTGAVTDFMRIYAAHWGMVLITPTRWPIPALCDEDLLWSDGDLEGPGISDRRTLRSLVRPLTQVLAPQPDGSWRVPPMAAASDILARLRVWDYWSDRAWEWWDGSGRGRFEMLLEKRIHRSLRFAA